MQFSHKGAVIEPRGPPKGGSLGRSLRETAGRSFGVSERFRLANGGLMQIVGFEGLAGCFAGPTGTHSLFCFGEEIFRVLMGVVRVIIRFLHPLDYGHDMGIRSEERR